jgi:hypothetical protein
VLVPCFMIWNKRSQKCSIRTKKLISLIWCAQMCLYPCKWAFLLWQDNPHTWQVWHIKIRSSWLNSMIITHVHLVLGTIKCHSKMCRTSTSGFFTCGIVWGQPPRQLMKLRCISVCNKSLLWGKKHSDWLDLALQEVGLVPISWHKARPRYRHRRQMVGVLQC